MSAITAFNALFDVANLRAGERLLVHGAGGAAGGMAVQLAKSRGIWAVATATGGDLLRLRGRGVDRVIEYKAERFEDILAESVGVDVVLDVLACETRDRSWRVLNEGGQMASTLGPTEPPPEAAKRGVLGLPGFGASPNGAPLRDIAGMIERGEIVVDPPTPFSLERAAEAMDAAQTGNVRGKVVIIMGAGS